MHQLKLEVHKVSDRWRYRLLSRNCDFSPYFQKTGEKDNNSYIGDSSHSLIGEEKVVLTKELIKCGLSQIERTLDTLEYAFTKFDCRRR